MPLLKPWTLDIPVRAYTPGSEYGDADNEDVLVIGLDFGTTYSGVAWTTKEEFNREEIRVIQSWPGLGGEEVKTPTELYHEDDNTMWGFQIESDLDPIKWFKLLLLKDEDLPSHIRSSEFLLRARKMMRENGKTAIDLVSEYLRKIWEHTLHTIAKDRGETVLESLRFHVVITVPAIWKDYARVEMEQAAKMAGILDDRSAGQTILTFAPEPEAAALSTLTEPGRKTKAGEVYLVCDAGGGTVDLITYKIRSVNPILLDEAVEGTGGLCGGIFIDEAFEFIIKHRLGRKWDRLSNAGIKEMLKKEWELSIKPQFNPTNSKKEYLVSIPAEAFGEESVTDMTKEPYIKKGRIHFNESHLKKAFAGVFASIDKLIEAQIRKVQDQGLSLTGIILVGGLGCSPYLYEHLKARHSPANISILQSSGVRPRSAICRGALYKGFLSGSSSDSSRAPISVISTISRASYGAKYRTKFDDDMHLKEDKVWSDEEQDWMAHNQMEWYLREGDNVSTKDPVSHEYYKLCQKEVPRTFAVELWKCEDENPPLRGIDSVKLLNTINCRVDLPFSALEDYRNTSGEKYKKLNYDLKMVPSGASVEFAVFVDGKRVGKSNNSVHLK